VEVDI